MGEATPLAHDTTVEKHRDFSWSASDDSSTRISFLWAPMVEDLDTRVRTEDSGEGLEWGVRRQLFGSLHVLSRFIEVCRRGRQLVRRPHFSPQFCTLASARGLLVDVTRRSAVDGGMAHAVMLRTGGRTKKEVQNTTNSGNIEQRATHRACTHPPAAFLFFAFRLTYVPLIATAVVLLPSSLFCLCGVRVRPLGGRGVPDARRGRNLDRGWPLGCAQRGRRSGR